MVSAGQLIHKDCGRGILVLRHTLRIEIISCADGELSGPIGSHVPCRNKPGYQRPEGASVGSAPELVTNDVLRYCGNCPGFFQCARGLERLTGNDEEGFWVKEVTAVHNWWSSH